ncbi:methionyl aminopeptidase [Ramaria rubella]|nr:methionyl aminopeptidase [Ramaria rubella]
MRQCTFLRNIAACIPSRKISQGRCYTRIHRIHTPSVDEFNSFGSYSLILPPEPFVEGVAHISMKSVPDDISRPPYAKTSVPKNDPSAGDPYEGDGRIVLGSEDETKLRRATSLAKLVLHRTREWIKVGTTTDQVDAQIHRFIVSKGAYPSPLGYAGFPKSCCTSVNNVIAHGIPDYRPLEDGDIVNVDITVYLDGFHGDTSQTFLVGTVDTLGIELVHATNLALKAGIDACGPHKPLKDIGCQIDQVTAQLGYSVNSQFTGHGIGRVFHRPPWILHHKNDEPGIMLPGHVFTIEPSLVQGLEARGWMYPDGWTVATESGARSAQAEHTVLITDTGVDVLT